MPHKETIVRVFVSSPRDLADERADLEDIVREVNHTWSRNLGIRLDLVKWETHGYPGLGADAQAVINTELGDDYDIFIGMFHTIFGTPTNRAGSGTEEEFDRALARYRKDPNSLRLMFYFKDVPIPPSQLDAEQIAKIKNFQNQLGPEGALWWKFNSRDNFLRLMRVHLSRQIQELGRTWGKGNGIQALERVANVDTPAKDVNTRDLGQEAEEEGFLDLVERSVEEFKTAAEVTQRLTRSMSEMGEKVTARATELATAPTIDQQKRILQRTAENLEQFASETEAAIPFFSSGYSRGIDAYARSATLLKDFRIDDTAILRNALETVRNMEGAFDTAYAQIGRLREIMSRLPRATTNLNRSKRRALAVIDRLMTELTNAKTLTSEAAKTMESLIE